MLLSASRSTTTYAARIAAISIGVCLLMSGAPASAQDVGVRAGVSGDPDQFYAGVHGEFGPVVEDLYFRPNLELGFGSDVTVVTGNVEFIYKIPLSSSPWSLYLGAGPALVIATRDDDTDAGGGVNIIVGVEHSRGFFTELKVGAADSPGVKWGVGYTFRR